MASLGGLSPRIRGNLRRLHAHGIHHGSIPTHTGEPRKRSPQELRVKVYPRAYGGTAPNRAARRRRGGLSPRIRGNPGPLRLHDVDAGSIPAHTGEPSGRADLTGDGKVYPRAYGGTGGAGVGGLGNAGLSPRIRGNRDQVVRRRRAEGSIPAHTGEPGELDVRKCLKRVYPRAYGGTRARHQQQFYDQGLSPRIRGNLHAGFLAAARARSIPAHTGEPSRPPMRNRANQVYPRAYGGTIWICSSCCFLQGLSPRIRGNQGHGQTGHAENGSIPAHTGEPRASAQFPYPNWVYPRAYGGTRPTETHAYGYRGLSPRIRGNLVGYVGRVVVLGSIPAHTGEPSSGGSAADSVGVYPRAYGGTVSKRS